MTAVYLDTPAQWAASAAYAREAKILGLDSETVGHDVTETSPAYRASIHVWSIAFYTGDLSPLGYRTARGAVLPMAALPAFAAVLADPTITKVAHNARHDRHAFENHGVMTYGVIDTLDLVRLAYPERGLRPDQGFRLKPLAQDLLAKDGRDDYRALLKGSQSVKKTTLVCVCGVNKCRKRKGPEHAKQEIEEFHEEAVDYRLDEILPGHPHWQRLLDYAAADAVDALELYDLATWRIKQTARPQIPWL